MQFVPDWKKAWRWFSVHALVIAGVIPAVWDSLSPEMKSYVPASVMCVVTGFVAVCGVIGRLVKQAPDEGGQK